MTARLTAVAALVLAGGLWWFSLSPDEPEREWETSAPGPEKAAIDRLLARTVEESRTGGEAVESLPTGPAEPVEADDGAFPRNADPQPQSPAPGSADESPEALPAGYTLGAYRGPMLRAPRTNPSTPEPAPNPDWFGAGSASGAIPGQAALSGRPFSFAVLRVLAGTDLPGLGRSLAALGAQFEGHSGEFVRVRVPSQPGVLDAMAALPGVMGLGVIPPELKAPASFVQDMLARPAGEPVPVFITLMASDAGGEWRRALAGLGVVPGAYDNDLRSYTANLSPAVLPRVLAADFVLSVEPVPIATANHSSAVPVMGVDGFRSYDPVMRRFTGRVGSGIAVGVLDTGLNTNHVDIVHDRASICGANFVSNEDWDLWIDLGGHGTHVFGTIAGAGRANPLLAGMAPGLSHLRFGKVLSAEGYGSSDDIRRGMDYLSGATGCIWRGAESAAVKPLIVNMSLSATSLAFSGRGVGERKLDAVVRSHSQLYVVAQSNSGVHGFSNYGTAKNSLAVGAVDDSGIVAGFSSLGPTADGRLAPNVVGTGVGLTSTRGEGSVSGHVTYSGTSMASPSVAGVAALLMEARPEFRNQPALTRARLMASAVRPDAYFESREQLPRDNSEGPGKFQNLYGQGLVSARASIFSRDTPTGWLVGSATARPEQDSYEYVDIQVPEGARRLDIVMTWDEQPADTLTRSVLNNLDLWVDRGADCAEDACGEYASRSEVDNVEWLFIEDPMPGAYRVKVVPVEIYGESSTAAVAWTVLRGEPAPTLRLEVEDTSPNADSEYITLDVTIEASHYLASGTTLHLSCRGPVDCNELREAYYRYRNSVLREDGLSWSEQNFARWGRPEPISVGEVAAGTPRRVQLAFLRDELPADSSIHITASSWNAEAAGQSLALGADATVAGSDRPVPANDAFSSSEQIEGATGEIALDPALASREPGEPLVDADTRTLWYTWEASSTGIFRFRAEEEESGEPVEADFALFTGDKLTNLEIAAQKQGSEISFAAQAGTVYRLRVASGEWDLPPLVLTWESADTRPANDDFAYAQAINGESGSIEASNEGATLEASEFLDGAVASVWFEWTAPGDGLWFFEAPNLMVLVFEGSGLGELRLISTHSTDETAYFMASEGTTYRIAVTAGSADDSGARFTLGWGNNRRRAIIDITDSLFENANEIESTHEGSTNVVQTNSSRLLVEPGEPLQTGIHTSWGHWTAPSDGQFTWTMDGSHAYRLSFFTGDALENLQFLDGLRGGATLVLDATAGTRYWIALGKSPEHLRDPYPRPDTIRWGPTPANNFRIDAGLLAGATGSASAQLIYATSSSNDPADTVGANSVWWRWTAPASGWQRFWVEENPLSALLAVYPDNVSTRAIADSERSFLANGRVELHLQAEAGRTYDIRVSTRPRIPPERAARIRWTPADAPIHLAYRGAVTSQSLALSPAARGFRGPLNLAMNGNGDHLFSSSDSGIFAFGVDAATGELVPAWRATDYQDSSRWRASYLRNARLQWNPYLDRLIAQIQNPYHSLSLPQQTTYVGSIQEMERSDGTDRWIYGPLSSSPDGQHLYAIDDRDRLLVHRVDSATQLTLAQLVIPPGAAVSADVDTLTVPDIGDALAMTYSTDGSTLYVITEQDFIVFQRDPSSGKLALTWRIRRSLDPENPFREMGPLKNLAVHPDGNLLFVLAPRLTGGITPAFNAAVAIFDISTDPSNPAHLDTLTQVPFEKDLEVRSAWYHIQPRPWMVSGCHSIVARNDSPAADIFCYSGFLVVAWNAEANELEVTDFAMTGEEDRYGNRLPYALGNDSRQLAQHPDGSRVYAATNLGSEELSDAIHIFERAGAMQP